MTGKQLTKEKRPYVTHTHRSTNENLSRVRLKDQREKGELGPDVGK